MSEYVILYANLLVMGKGTVKLKNDRTSRLLGLLRSDDHWTTLRLAEELEISHRTLMRDLNDLKEAGYPIETERGRGGGIRLDGRWGLDRLNITNKEAISLLLCLSVMEALTPQGNELGAKGLKQKIANAFPESQRKSIIELRKRILIGKTASTQILDNFQKNDKMLEDIMLSFFESKKVLVEYQDEKSKKTIREIDPHYLLINWPVWYLLGWDYLRSDVRIFRIDRITATKILNVHIVRRPQSLFLNAYEEYFHHL